MDKVMKADGSSGADAWAQIDLGSNQAEIWKTYDVAFTADALAVWISDGQSSKFSKIWNAAHSTELDWVMFFAGQWSNFEGFGPIPAPVAAIWQLCEERHVAGGAVELYFDNVLVTSNTTGLTDQSRFVQAGNIDAILNPDNISYLKNFKVGTTRGGDELFSDDFSSGDFSAWTSTSGAVSVIDDPFAPPPGPRRVFADLPVRVFVTNKDSRTLTIFDKRATDKQFLFPLNAPAYHTGQVASDDPEVNLPFPDADSPANLTNNRRLVFALQRWQGYDPPYQPIFAGIVTTVEDQGTDAPTTRYTASDPWQYMMSRPYRHPDTGALLTEDYTFPDNTPGSYIAMIGLVNTFAVDGETHIDTDGTAFPLVEDTDGLTGFTVNAGQSLGEVWIALCETGTIDIHLPPIYDPIDRPGKCCEFQTVRQALGVAAGPVRFNAVMAWDKPGNSLMGVNRLVDGTRLANSMNYFAGDGVPAPVETDAASITAYGVYWAQQFFPGTTDVNLVNLLALAELLIRRNGARSISLDPAPERVEVPLRDYGPGDYLPVWASRNLREPLGVDYDSFDPDNPGASGYQRIYAIPLTVGDNGVTSVPGILTSKEN